jgi:hypothetical protein
LEIQLRKTQSQFAQYTPQGSQKNAGGLSQNC